MKQVNAIAGYDVRKTLPSALSPSIPILIVHGTEDVAVFFSERKHVTKLLPHAQLVEAPGEDYGHQWYIFILPWLRLELICAEWQV